MLCHFTTIAMQCAPNAPPANSPKAAHINVPFETLKCYSAPPMALSPAGSQCNGSIGVPEGLFMASCPAECQRPVAQQNLAGERFRRFQQLQSFSVPGAAVGKGCCGSLSAAVIA